MSNLTDYIAAVAAGYCDDPTVAAIVRHMAELLPAHDAEIREQAMREQMEIERLGAERKGTVRLTLEQARALEWAGCSACADEGASCLWCEEPHSAGHDSRCWLAAAIKEAQGE